MYWFLCYEHSVVIRDIISLYLWTVVVFQASTGGTGVLYVGSERGCRLQWNSVSVWHGPGTYEVFYTSRAYCLDVCYVWPSPTRTNKSSIYKIRKQTTNLQQKRTQFHVLLNRGPSAISIGPRGTSDYSVLKYIPPWKTGIITRRNVTISAITLALMPLTHAEETCTRILCHFLASDFDESASLCKFLY